MTERDSRTAKRATSPLRGGDPRPVGRGEGRRAPSETVESARAHSWLPAEPCPASPRWGRARWSRVVLADLARNWFAARADRGEMPRFTVLPFAVLGLLAGACGAPEPPAP